MTQTSFLYEGGAFTPFDYNLGASSQNWDAHMKELGWRALGNGHMPTHQNHEFVDFEAFLWERPDSGLLLADVWFQGSLFVSIYCHDNIQFLFLLRDLLLPLVKYGATDVLLDAVMEASHCLFDERNGLTCAQRVKGQDARDDARVRELRRQSKEAER
jgi:hypothetical protein